MLVFVTALACEARPLIDHFKLKAKTHFPFSIYQNANRWLIVSGVGKINTAFAIGYLLTMLDKFTAAWLNVGIAGHRSLSIGTGILANKIFDNATKRCHYPVFLNPPLAPTFSLCSVDCPETVFAEEHVYEMEAAAFAPSAMRFSSAELVHCYKVISDNQMQNIGMDAQKITELVQPHVEKISAIGDDLEQLSLAVFRPLDLDPWLCQWHFTESQQHRLARLLNQLRALNETVLTEEFLSLAKAKDVLYALKQKIDSYMFYY